MPNTKSNTRTSYRRADNGQYTSEQYAKKHPKTTVKETEKLATNKKTPSGGKTNINIHLLIWDRSLLRKGTRRRLRKGPLSVSEIMTSVIYFPQSHYRNLKAYYSEHAC